MVRLAMVLGIALTGSTVVNAQQCRTGNCPQQGSLLFAPQSYYQQPQTFLFTIPSAPTIQVIQPPPTILQLQYQQPQIQIVQQATPQIQLVQPQYQQQQFQQQRAVVPQCSGPQCQQQQVQQRAPIVRQNQLTITRTKIR